MLMGENDRFVGGEIYSPFKLYLKSDGRKAIVVAFGDDNGDSSAMTAAVGEGGINKSGSKPEARASSRVRLILHNELIKYKLKN